MIFKGPDIGWLTTYSILFLAKKKEYEMNKRISGVILKVL